MSFNVDEIIGNPKELLVGEEIEVKVSFSGVTGEKQYYLFLAFRKPESGAYNFGFTANNDGDWIKYGDNFDNFYRIEIKESSWSGVLKAKPDYQSKGFKCEGEYQIRAGRYVSSNNESWAEGQDLRIFLKAPTPTSTPTPTPTPVPTQTPTPTPTATPSPTSTPTPTPTPTIPRPTPTPPLKPVVTSLEGDVLGEGLEQEENGNSFLSLNEEGVVSEKKDETKDIKELYQPPENKKSLLFPVLTVSGGLAFIGFAIWSFLKQEKEASDVV